MSDFEPLPEVPNYQLQTPGLSLSGYTPPSLGLTPPLTTDPSLGLGGGSSAALMAALGHLTDPPMAPTGTPMPGPVPSLGPQPLFTGSDFVSRQLGGVINPWLANTMGPSEDVQRQLDTLPPIDPGVAQQQTILTSPTIRW